MRRRAKYALVVLVLATTPFFWSVGRDLLPFLFAGKGETEKAKIAIALQLIAEHKRMHLGDPPPMASMELPHNCYTVSWQDVRTRFRLLNKIVDQIDEDSRSRPEKVSMLSYGIAYAAFEEQRSVEALQKNLSPVELATLNGCMAATPFSTWCDGLIKRNMGVDFRLVEHDLVVRGLMRHAVDDRGTEIRCTTIPIIEEGTELP